MSRTKISPLRANAARLPARSNTMGASAPAMAAGSMTLIPAAGQIDAMQVDDGRPAALGGVVDGAAVGRPVGALHLRPDPIRIGHDSLESHRRSAAARQSGRGTGQCAQTGHPEQAIRNVFHWLPLPLARPGRRSAGCAHCVAGSLPEPRPLRRQGPSAARRGRNAAPPTSPAPPHSRNLQPRLGPRAIALLDYFPVSTGRAPGRAHQPHCQRGPAPSCGVFPSKTTVLVAGSMRSAPTNAHPPESSHHWHNGGGSHG